MKKIPMRMCIACRQMRPKKELMRVVKTAQGSLVFDAIGKQNGRGAYLCRSAECLERAFKTRALERALEAPINEELKTALETEIERNGSAV